jgi:AcrR family transcriptional regulator
VTGGPGKPGQRSGRDEREQGGRPHAPSRRPGRRAGDSGTREAILDAARGQFATVGYYRGTIRAIAAEAGVDPALVHHYFGTKEALFAAAMRLPIVPSEVISAALAPVAGEAAGSGSSSRAGQPGEAGGLGEVIVRTALTVWETPGLRETMLGLLRSAVASEQVAVMLREYVAESILGTVARVVGLGGPGSGMSPAEAEYRIGMVATQMLGLAMARMVLGFPAVAGASVDDLAATIGPSVERYLTGDIPIPVRRRRRAAPRASSGSATAR